MEDLVKFLGQEFGVEVSVVETEPILHVQVERLPSSLRFIEAIDTAKKNSNSPQEVPVLVEVLDQQGGTPCFIFNGRRSDVLGLYSKFSGAINCFNWYFYDKKKLNVESLTVAIKGFIKQ